MNRNFKDLKSTTHLSTSDFISFKHPISVITVVVCGKFLAHVVLFILLLFVFFSLVVIIIEPEIATAGIADVAVCFCHDQLRQLKWWDDYCFDRRWSTLIEARWKWDLHTYYLQDGVKHEWKELGSDKCEHCILRFDLR